MVDVQEPRRRRTAARARRTVWVVVAVVVVLVVVVAVLGVREMQRQAIPPPSFPSLQETPDSSLHGTLAYLSGTEKHPGTADESGTGKDRGDAGATETGSWCVRVMAVAGSPAKNGYCIPLADLDGMVGPQLRWRPDDRLEVTMFRSSETGPIGPGWQRVVDVRTGAVEEVPASEVPAAPTTAKDPTVGPSGERVTLSQSNGHVEVELETPTGSRALLEASGNPSYSASLAGWSPDGKWLLVDDGRLLLVTVDDHPYTRVLVDDLAAHGDVDGAGITPYSITGDDLLSSGD